MKNILKSVSCFVFVSVLFCILKVSANTDFELWKQDFYQEALKEGVSKTLLDKVLPEMDLLERVIRLDTQKPVYIANFYDYMKTRIEPIRIEKGRKMLKKYPTWLSRVEEKYGIPKQYILAFWGMETNYGSFMGSVDMLDSLATLAYHPRRRRFFTNELIAYLKIVEKKGLSAPKIGSWDGGFGNFQFMPTTYLAFGIDADGDGCADIFNSIRDAMASAANYLAAEGWRKGERWGREVRLPKNFDWSLIEKQKTLKEWKKLGISFVEKINGAKEPDTLKASLILPEGIEGPAFLAYPNFYVMMRWNKSVLYALSVGYLADRINNRAGFKTLSSTKPARFTMENAMEVQRILLSMGLYKGDIDGILGAKSREAVRAFQTKYDLPPDGYANAGLLTFMRLVSTKKNTQENLTFDEIVEVQKILSKGKYYVGPLDGKLGKSTREGIELFKQVYNIRSNKTDRRLLVKMRLHAGRNMENGDIEPIVRDYHRQKEKERRLAQEERRKALILAQKEAARLAAIKAAKEEAERKQREREQREAALRRAEEMLGRVLTQTLERASSQNIKKTLTESEKK